MDTSSGRQGIPSGSRTAYLTVGQVRDWILYRESEILQEPAKDQFPISDGDIQTLQDVIAGKTVADSRSVDALLQLLAALETGRVKATGRLNRFADTSLPRSLPAHYWPHLTFTNRTPSVGWETYSQTCATLKTEPGGRFWSHLLFDAKRVLTVWPPYTVRGQPTGEEVGLLDPAAQPRHVEASRDVRKADRRLRPAPESMIHNMISEVYNEAETTGQKPPNVKEIIAPVQLRLNAKGYEASGRRIQRLADANKHKNRRRRPGITMKSEKRWQRR